MDRKRKLKTQGSCKINMSCTSQIILEKTSEGYFVIFYRNHYGHSTEIQHLTLLEEDRNELASKLSSGTSLKK